MWIWVLTAAFCLILLVLTMLNAKVNGGFKIETSWIALALSPAVIWLLATGQLAEFSGFGLAFKLKEASGKAFSLNMEGDRIDPAPVTVGEKEGMGKIPEFIERRVAALEFQLHRRSYYSNSAIRQYLEGLTTYEFFRYVVFVGMDGVFRGIMPARALLQQMRQQNLDLVQIIEEGALDRLPGVRTVTVSTNSSKREALKKMADQNLSELPVVDERRHFIGIVEREKLTSSILLQLVAQL